MVFDGPASDYVTDRNVRWSKVKILKDLITQHRQHSPEFCVFDVRSLTLA